MQVFLVWTVPLIIMLIPLTWWFGPERIKMAALRVYVNIMWTLLLLLVVAMTVLYVLATKGAKQIIHNQGSTPGHARVGFSRTASVIAKKELRVVHLFGFLLFFFSAAYFPILYINFCDMIGMPDLAPPWITQVSRYLLLTNNALNPVLCILLTRDYFYTLKTLVGYVFRSRSGDRYIFVPSSANFVRRKVLWKKMRGNRKFMVTPLVWESLRESNV